MNKTILIIDDDELLATALKQQLLLSQYFPLVALNEQDGLKLALSEHPDLIILDWRLAECSGEKFLQGLRKDSWGKTAAVIVFSGDVSTEHVNVALENKVTYFLSKSETSLDVLMEQIKEHVG